MYKKSLCVVILAAGNSSRFGANKLLYPINNIPMYQYTLNLIKKLNPKQTILVTKYPEITKKIDPNIIIIPNYDTHLGQSHSMQLAIKASQQLSSADNTNDNNIDGYLFIVCDQPFLTMRPPLSPWIASNSGTYFWAKITGLPLFPLYDRAQILSFFCHVW